MKMRFFISAISFVFLSVINAGGDQTDWKFLSESNANRWYFEVPSADAGKKVTVRVWGKSVAKGKAGIEEKIKLLRKFGGQPVGYENYSYTLNLFELDCPARRSRILSVKDYDQKGSPLESVSVDDFPWDHIAPGTIMERLHSAVCPSK